MVCCSNGMARNSDPAAPRRRPFFEGLGLCRLKAMPVRIIQGLGTDAGVRGSQAARSRADGISKRRQETAEDCHRASSLLRFERQLQCNGSNTNDVLGRDKSRFRSYSQDENF